MTAERWQRLKLLFEAAVEKQGHDRSGFVATAAISDPDLASQLGNLLENHTAATSLFDQPALSRSRVLQFMSGAAGAFRVDEIIAQRFRIDAFLGAGGMGEVYQATDLELGGTVAVKTLRRAISDDPEMLTRFKQEIQLSRRVTHPNVCRIFDLFQHQTPENVTVAFVTMELLEGETLAQKIRESGPMPAKAALPLVQQIAEGLAAAHHAGIVHGDFKSGNVMLIPADQHGFRAVVTDFGLARDYRVVEEDQLEPAGTPAYIAPEQLEGKPLTPACDIYALGVVMYEIITGRLPFEGETGSVIAGKRLRQTAPLARSAMPSADGTWEAAIRRCLERDPAKRPASAIDVVRALEGHRRRWFVALGAGAVSAAVLIRLRFDSPPVFAAEAVISYERGEEFLKRRTQEGLQNAVEEYHHAVRREPGYADAWAGLAAAWSSIAQFRFGDPASSWSNAQSAARRAIALDRNCGRAYGVLAYCTSINVHTWLEAEPYFRQALAVSPNSSDIRLWYGAYLSKRGRSAEAIAQLRSGLQRDPTSMVLNLQLASEYFMVGNAGELRRQASELVRLQPFEAVSHLMMARSLELDGRYEEALQSCDEAVKYRHPAAALCVRGSIEASRGNLPEARRIAGEIEKAWSENPNTESLLLAGLYCKLGDRQKALDVLFKGYERNDATVLMAATHPHLALLANEPRYHEFLRKLGLKR